MNDKSTAIEAIIEIKQKIDYHFEKSVFCGEHNMLLEQIMHRKLEEELKKISFMLQKKFETGYVSAKA